MKSAVLVHVITHKGKGFIPAERHPARFHGAEPFDIETGLPSNKKEKAAYTDIFSTVMRKLGDRNENVVAITAAMETGTGLKRFHNMFPERFFDVGIAEQDLMTTALGLSLEGFIPFAATFAVFATGRAYDQIRNSICYQKSNVKIIGAHGGITVGEDGASHQALEDVSLMRGLPNMTVIVPGDYEQTRQAVRFAASYNGPVYILSLIHI